MSTKEKDEEIPVVDAEPVDSETSEEETGESESSSGEEGAQTAQPDGTWPQHLVHSFGHSLVQGPIDGVREVVNTLSGSKVIPKIEVIKPPDKAEISTPEWQAQKAGSGAGLLAAGIVLSAFLFRRR